MEKIIRFIKDVFCVDEEVSEQQIIKSIPIYNKYEVTTQKYYGLQGLKKEIVYFYVGDVGQAFPYIKEFRLPRNYKLLERFVKKDENGEYEA